ncbi:hypothetical protein JCM19239_7322 [Vibrio variabilis]|uniref:Uncharacterized protein n=1 Tax=Vibrio variabilis TaxID=990271 RepID=A0ABQ0J7I3_9VIBR|nr:hypothetical protein JCM19239_7322 [Vibrio variabilis]
MPNWSHFQRSFTLVLSTFFYWDVNQRKVSLNPTTVTGLMKNLSKITRR